LRAAAEQLGVGIQSDAENRNGRQREEYGFHEETRLLRILGERIVERRGGPSLVNTTNAKK
jgi:hypothetical protein